MKIFKVLAAILHLGNINFDSDLTTGRCQIVHNTKNHFCYAAQLSEIEQKIVETSLLTRKIEVQGSDPIM